MTRFSSSVIVFFGMLLCLFAVASKADDAKTSNKASLSGHVTGVTLYRGQALVTRTIPLSGGEGGMEIVVGPLPEQVVPDSLFAEGGEGVEIRAVRFRSRAIGEEPREEVRKLDQIMEELSDRRQTVQRRQAVLAKHDALLDQMEHFVVPTMKTDLARGFLDAEALEKLIRLSLTQREVVAEKTGELNRQLKDIKKELTLLMRKRGELTNGAQNAVREALLFVEKRSEAPGTVRLGYLVNNCGWSPTYTFRGGSDGKEVAVECNAIITQTTGEDWNGVELTLSTASPALSAAGPGMGPFPISLTSAKQRNTPSESEVAAWARDIQGRKAEAIQQRQTVVNLNEGIRSSWAANSAANDYQSLELAIGKEVINSSSTAMDTEGPSLSYRIANPVSLPGRSDQQMVRIMKTSFKSVFYHVATPVLSGYVYREAELVNDGGDDLLAGPIAVYLDGRFVGRSEIPTVARGQTFVVGFGADPQLRARRELVKRNDVVQGGNRELSFEYRLVIENFKDAPALVRLFDRAPHSDRPAEVRIKLGDMTETLSEDQLYLRTERPKNILRWDIEVPGRAMGNKAKMIEYGFTVEFDRQLTVSLPNVAANKGNQPMPVAAPAAMIEERIEFENFQRSKMAR